MKTYIVNGKTISIKTHEFSGTQNLTEYENQIYNALSKIGVEKEYINLEITDKYVKLNWEINQNKFEFVCMSQQNPTQNLGAISQAIQEDVRQIMRGIKDLNLVMKQYGNIEGEIITPKTMLDFSKNKQNQNKKPELKNNLNKIFPNKNDKQKSLQNLENFKKNNENNKTQKVLNFQDESEIEQIEINSDIEAKMIIEEIKEKYPKFTNYVYLPHKDKQKLKKAYAYLGKIVDF